MATCTPQVLGVARGVGAAEAGGGVGAAEVGGGVGAAEVGGGVVAAGGGSGTLQASCAASRASFAFCFAFRAARSCARARVIAESSAVLTALTWRRVAVRITRDWVRVARAPDTAGLAMIRSSAACCAARLALCCLTTCRAAYVSILANT